MLRGDPVSTIRRPTSSGGLFAMLLGPIFRAELLRTSRRRLFYVMRFLYGILLLFIIWASYQGTTVGKEMVTIDEAAEFALATFVAFAVIQLITLLLLIPAL